MKFRTLKLLHVSICVTFITFDKEIILNANVLRKMGVEVITA
ncbi:MAG: hypothetical protein QW738_08150 [Nitrososphaeria archaeon]